MRLVLPLLALLALATVLPVASADGGSVPVSCDIDDDLYQHCNAGPVHVVYGPLCAGVKVGGPAECRRLADPTA